MKAQAGSLLQMVSRFNLGAGDEFAGADAAVASPPTLHHIVTPSPIRVRGRPARPAAGSVSVAAALSRRASSKGEWKEFQGLFRLFALGWSGRWESNPRYLLGKQESCH